MNVKKFKNGKTGKTNPGKEYIIIFLVQEICKPIDEATKSLRSAGANGVFSIR